MVTYAAGKAAVAALTVALAEEVATLLIPKFDNALVDIHYRPLQ